MCLQTKKDISTHTSPDTFNLVVDFRIHKIHIKSESDVELLSSSTKIEP